VDCGLKYNQIRCFLKRGARVDIVPWNHPLDDIDNYDGLFLSNGPGNPEMNKETILNIQKVLNNTSTIKPIFGICLGHQLLATAAGCKTYKMKLVVIYLLSSNNFNIVFVLLLVCRFINFVSLLSYCKKVKNIHT